MNKPFDFTGREIRVGNTCIYPVRRGSKMWLQRMAVTQIEPIEDGFRLRGYSSLGRKVNVTNLQCVIVLDH